MLGFASLFSANDLELAALVDYADGVKRKVARLNDVPKLSGGRVLRCDSYAEGDEADIEDIIGAEMYTEIIDRRFPLPPDRAFRPPKQVPQMNPRPGGQDTQQVCSDQTPRTNSVMS